LQRDSQIQEDELILLIEHQMYHSTYASLFYTTIKISGHEYLVLGSYDSNHDSHVNTSLAGILPGLHWHGDVVVFRLGVSVPFFQRRFTGEEVYNVVRM
jgi:hypothetical protein